MDSESVEGPAPSSCQKLPVARAARPSGPAPPAKRAARITLPSPARSRVRRPSTASARPSPILRPRAGARLSRTRAVAASAPILNFQPRRQRETCSPLSVTRIRPSPEEVRRAIFTVPDLPPRCQRGQGTIARSSASSIPPILPPPSARPRTPEGTLEAAGRNSSFLTRNLAAPWPPPCARRWRSAEPSPPGRRDCTRPRIAPIRDAAAAPKSKLRTHLPKPALTPSPARRPPPPARNQPQRRAGDPPAPTGQARPPPLGIGHAASSDPAPAAAPTRSPTGLYRPCWRSSLCALPPSRRRIRQAHGPWSRRLAGTAHGSGATRSRAPRHAPVKAQRLTNRSNTLGRMVMENFCPAESTSASRGNPL